MIGDYEIKHSRDIRYNDLELIVTQFFGKSDLQHFLNTNSPEYISRLLGEYGSRTDFYWLQEYEHGNIFVLKFYNPHPALTYTENGYEVTSSNHPFFNRSLEWLIKTLRPTTVPLARHRTVKTVKEVNEPIVEKESKKEVIPKGLTVFLGGAGMRGNYQYDFIKTLKDAGISNVVRGNYSAFLYGKDEQQHEIVDTVADATAVIFYNQDTNDPIALQLVDTRGCEVGTEIEFLNLKYVSYKGKTIKNEDCPNTYRYELDTPSEVKFDLTNIQVNNPVPQEGQFNFIGYSWGSVVAARTALEYANTSIKVHHLVLIGSPINYSLLQAVQNNSNIENVIIKDLTEFGDPIYAGMTDDEILKSAFKLLPQMNDGTGHFYYSNETNDGKIRRIKLSKELYNKGLR